ncbi:hypothetical protein BpHYR1_049517 [Brachionus plicatilis]|uniref:Uncharacterized protein n=1 Tax=Brachionus plicatilis TaxID=10195 RepID=A0A3M7R8X2_BRAPC|nr:hypothetical protein BpHYR1_049517 [Brachionus plicatilis]
MDKNIGSNDSQNRKNFEKNYMSFIIQGNSSKNSNNRVFYFSQILRDVNKIFENIKVDFEPLLKHLYSIGSSIKNYPLFKFKFPTYCKL